MPRQKHIAKYDSFSQPHAFDAAWNSKPLTNILTPYLFTGRRLDILNSGSLTIQYSRNRYYSPSLGRWYSQDPLGITPKAPTPNTFNITAQYSDTFNLYEYVKTQPIIARDPYGLAKLGPFDINWNINPDECWPTGSLSVAVDIPLRSRLMDNGLTLTGTYEGSIEWHDIEKEKCKSSFSPLDWESDLGLMSASVSVTGPDVNVSISGSSTFFAHSPIDFGFVNKLSGSGHATRKVWRNCRCGFITVQSTSDYERRSNIPEAVGVAAVAAAGVVLKTIILLAGAAGVGA